MTRMTIEELRALRATVRASRSDPLCEDRPWRVNDDPDGFVRIYSGYGFTNTLIADTMRRDRAVAIVALRNAADSLLAELIERREMDETPAPPAGKGGVSDGR